MPNLIDMTTLCTADNVSIDIDETGGIGWNNSIVYKAGDIVSVGSDKIFIALTNNQAIQPGSDPTIWDEFTAEELGGIAWQPMTGYREGDVVAEKEWKPGIFNVWVCIDAHISGSDFMSNVNKFQPVSRPAAKMKGWFNPNLNGGGGVSPIEDGTIDYDDGDYLVAQFEGEYDFGLGTPNPIGKPVGIGDFIRYDGSVWEVFPNHIDDSLMRGWFIPSLQGGGLPSPIIDGTASYEENEYIIAKEYGWYDFATGMPETAGNGTEVNAGDRILYEYLSRTWFVIGVPSGNDLMIGWFDPTQTGGGLDPYIINSPDLKYKDGQFVIAIADGAYNFDSGVPDITGTPVRKGDLYILDNTRTWQELKSSNDGHMKGWFDPTIQDGQGPLTLYPVKNNSTDYLLGQYLICIKYGEYNFDTGLPDSSGTPVQSGDRVMYDGTAWIAQSSTSVTESIRSVENQAGHGFNVGDPVHKTSLGWSLSKADRRDTLKTAIVSNVINASSFEVIYTGILEYPGHGYSPFTDYYLDPNNTGMYVDSEPEDGYIQKCFFPLGINKMLVYDYGETRRPVNVGSMLSAQYRFNNSTTVTDPGSGKTLIDQADPSLAQRLAISKIDRYSHDRSYGISKLSAGDNIALLDNNSSKSNIFELIGRPVDMGIYFEMPIQYVNHTGQFDNNERLEVEILFAGAGSGGASEEFVPNKAYGTGDWFLHNGYEFEVTAPFVAPTPEFAATRPYGLGQGHAFEYDIPAGGGVNPSNEYLEIIKIPVYSAGNLSFVVRGNGQHVQVNGRVNAGHNNLGLTFEITKYNTNIIDQIYAQQPADGQPWEIYIRTAIPDTVDMVMTVKYDSVLHAASTSRAMVPTQFAWVPRPFGAANSETIRVPGVFLAKISNYVVGSDVLGTPQPFSLVNINTKIGENEWKEIGRFDDVLSRNAPGTRIWVEYTLQAKSEDGRNTEFFGHQVELDGDCERRRNYAQEPVRDNTWAVYSGGFETIIQDNGVGKLQLRVVTDGRDWSIQNTADYQSSIIYMAAVEM